MTETSVEERTFTGRAGRTITYDVYGPTQPQRGVVVIVHGLAEHGRRYRYLAGKLVAAGYRVAIGDHAGHGRSGGKRLRVNRFADFTDDLDTVVDQVAIDGLPTFLIGHSMGGEIALDYALDHQAKLDGLILSGAAVMLGNDLPAPAAAVAKVLGKIAPALPTTALSSSAISRDPRVVADYDNDPLVTRGRIPAGLAAAMLSRMDTFPARLPGLQIPLLILHGGEDALTDPEGSKLVERLAGSADKTLVVYDGLYHEIFNEPERDEVIGGVLDWLSARTAQR